MTDYKDIIEKLRDDNEYYRGLGRKYLSNSDIDSLLNNPKSFGVPKEDNKGFAEGRLFHQLLIEPEKAKEVIYVDASSRTTKEYKSFCEQMNRPFVLLKKEVEDVKELTETMKRNITFFDEIYRDGNTYETPGIAEIHGMMWKGKADIITNDSIIDLKTTGDILKFKYSAKAYNYDSQCFIYEYLFKKPLVFFVIDKTTRQMGIFKPTDSFIESGEAKVRRAIDVYGRYFAEDRWDDINNHYIDDILL